MDMEQDELGYKIRVEKFEGPLDLLLHLIKKNEINIYDIPIAMIANQYLDYLSAMKSLNLGVAGEFLVMAATLLHIKSGMLLPPTETADDEEDGPDPREELVRRLLEYKQFKDAARQLDGQERMWREIYSRESAAPELVEESEDTLLEHVSLFDLVDALQGIMDRNPGKGLMEIEPDNLTVRDRMNAILESLEGKSSVTFASLFDDSRQRLVIIVTFLALLELVRLRVARVFQAETFGPILVSRTFSLVAETESLDIDEAEWRSL
jgi:segregation and condensation protein A